MRKRGCMNEVTFVEAVRMFGQFEQKIGSLTDNIDELADFLERESVAFKMVRPSFMLVWIDKQLNGKEDVYSIRYELLCKDGKYERQRPFLIFNCTAYKEWRQEHGVKNKYY